MLSDTFRLPTADTELFTYCWAPEGEPIAAVQIAHGMAEHAGRYERLAKHLTSRGYVVYANDHRGHGKTCNDDAWGYFGAKGGWQAVIDDMRALTLHIRKQHPALKVGLLGHSMGSYMTQTYMTQYGNDIDAAILSASSGGVGPIRHAGIGVLKIARLRVGSAGHSPLVDIMGFDAFNKAFKPNRTKSDWLTRDEAEVDKYLADPLCGFDCTVQLWLDLLTAMGDNLKKRQVKNIPQDLPVLLMTGEADSSNKGMEGIRKLANVYIGGGLRRVDIKGYPGGRHEMLNETNRDEVEAHIANWLHDALALT